MGLFGSSSKTYTSASVSRLVENKDIKDLHHAAILDYTLTNNDRVDALSTSFNDVYNRQLATCLGNNAIRISKYAESKYYYGVAAGYRIKKDSIDFMSIAKEYINKLTNKIPVVVYAKLGSINYNHATFYKLQQLYGYNFETNTLTVDGVVYYLKNFVITYTQSTITNAENPSFLDPLGLPATFGKLPTRGQSNTRSHTPWVVNSNAVNDYVHVELVRYEGNVEKVTYITLDFLEYVWSGKAPSIGEDAPTEASPDYFMISYMHDDVRTLILAKYSFGDIPELDKAVASDVDPGRYLPNFYVYRNGRPENAKSLKSGDAYKSSVKVCREMNLNYDELVTGVYDGIKSEESLQTAYITFRLAVNDFSDPIIQEYMYNYFYEMYKDSNDQTRSNYVEERSAQIDEQAKSGIGIYLGDRVSRTTLGYSSIGTKLVSGSIGKVGKCSGYYFGYSSGSSLFSGMKANGKAHTFRKQITENTYREVIVRGLNVNYGVDGGSDVSASGTDEELLIPIDIDIVVKRMGRYKQELITKALHLVVTAKKTVKKKWYQTGIFKVIMFVIAIVLSIVFPPAGIAAWSAMAVAYAVAVAVLVSVAVTLVSKLLYAMGIKSGVVMAIIAVIALIVGGYAALGNTSVVGLSATQILGISNVAFSISNNLNAMQMEARYKAYLDYTAQMDQEMEDLEQKRKDLGLDIYDQYDMFNLLSPSIYKPDIRLGESALSFLNRVTAITNTVDIYNELIPNYVLLSTQLPTIEDTIRGT